MSQEIFGPVYKEIFPFWNEIPKGDRDYICDSIPLLRGIWVLSSFWLL